MRMISRFRRTLGIALQGVFQIPIFTRFGQIIVAEWGTAVQRRAVSKVKQALAGKEKNDQNLIRRGPFRNMYFPFRYSDEALWLRKLIGSYEIELHPWIETICRYNYSVIINIGTAEGFYCVGLARRLPTARIIGFEMDKTARAACEALAIANNVADRVVLKGICNNAEMEILDLSGNRVLVVADCEGSEYSLLQPKNLTALKSCDLLVELHTCDGANEGAFERISHILSETHLLLFMPCQPRAAFQFEELAKLTKEESEAILAEGRRNSVGWVFAKSRLSDSE